MSPVHAAIDGLEPLRIDLKERTTKNVRFSKDECTPNHGTSSSIANIARLDIWQDLDRMIITNLNCWMKDFNEDRLFNIVMKITGRRYGQT